MIEISRLDHVAILAKNIKISEKWYRDILGLKRVFEEVWGDYPIMMMKNETGVAIFPAMENAIMPEREKFRIVDHFAFYVTLESFLKAQNFLTEKAIEWEYKNHKVYESIYFYDPDGYCVELTTRKNG